MKLKRALPLILIILSALCVLTFAACNTNICTVKFYVGDSVLAEYTVDKGEMLDVIPDVPAKEGFAGVWSVTDFDEINENLRVFAIYSPAYYNISFVVDGAVYSEKTLRKDSVLTDIPAVPQKVGYVGRWNITDFSNINSSITVTAEYTAVDATVIFTIDGVEMTRRFVPVGGSLGDIPQIPDISGRDLSSKWVIKDGKGFKDVDFSKIQDDITVEAHYFVTLGLEGGCDAETVELETNGKISAPSAGVKDGYTFMGWYADENYRVKCDFDEAFANNLTLYARWLENGGDDGFSFENGTVTGYEGNKKTLRVPFEYDDGGKKVTVTGVASGAFAASEIEEIILPSTVAVIQNGAFENCRLLKNIGFSDGNYLERIEKSAFENCVSLSSFEMSPFTEFIGERAFYSCTFMQAYDGLSTSSVKEIGDCAFAKNTAVKQFVLPAALAKIGASAFDGDGSATFDFSLLTQLDSVGNRAFGDCVRLTRFTVGSLVDIASGAFEGCHGLTAVTIPCDVALYTLFGHDVEEGFYGVTADGVTYAVPTMLRTVTVTAGDGDADKQLAAGKLASGAFYNCYSVKEVVFESGVKVISSGSFRTDRVTDGKFTVVLPSTLTEIEERAFETRDDLFSLELPASLQKIGGYAFYGVSSLSEVGVGANSALSYIGEYAFTGTKWLSGVQGVANVGRIAVGISEEYLAKTRLNKLVPRDFADVYTIAPYAFFGNSRLSSIELGSQIETVGAFAFAEMSGLTEIIFNSACANFGDGVLSGSVSVEAITLGASKRVEKLFGTEQNEGCYQVVRGEETYYVANSFKELTIIKDVAADKDECNVESGAYADLVSIEEVVIGEGITAVFDGAFANTLGLKTVNLPSSLKGLGVKVTTDGEEDEEYVGTFVGSVLESVIIAANSKLEIIYPNAFANTELQEFTVPASVTMIGKSAFENTALGRLRFEDGENPLTISERAFYAARGFRGYNLTTPARLVYIGKEAFAECSGIGGAVFRSGLKEIGEYAFANCGIATVALPQGLKIYDGENCVLKGAFTGNPVTQLTLNAPIKLVDLFDGSAPLTLIRINAYGAEIADGQFENTESVQKLELVGTETIGKNAFRGCSSLMSVAIPATVRVIGEYAFADCVSLSNFSFEIDSKLEKVEPYLFCGDIALRTVFFPKGVSGEDFIGVFDGCENLISANIPESVIRLGENAFRRNGSLTEITIPATVKTIGDGAFDGCGALEFTNVSFSDLTAIGERAFAGCVKLRGFNAESVETIGEGAFDGCVGLQSITVLDKRIEDYTGDAGGIRSVIIPAKATEAADGIFDNCNALVFVNVFVEGEATNKIVKKLLDEVGENNVKIFVTAQGYKDVSAEVKAQGEGKIYVNPSEINGEYTFNAESNTATLTKATFSGAVLYVPAYIYKEGVEYAVSEIGRSVFGGNKTVKEVIIPATVEVIGSDAFRASSVERVAFENGSGLKTINSNAFYGCNRLTEMELPDSLERIESGAFCGAEELSTLVYSEFGKLGYIGEYAFSNAKKLTEIKFYGKELLIDKNAFERSGLVKVEFAKTIEKLTLGENSFAHCEDLLVPELPAWAEAHETAFAR